MKPKKKNQKNYEIREEKKHHGQVFELTRINFAMVQICAVRFDVQFTFWLTSTSKKKNRDDHKQNNNNNNSNNTNNSNSNNAILKQRLDKSLLFQVFKSSSSQVCIANTGSVIERNQLGDLTAIFLFFFNRHCLSLQSLYSVCL